MCEALNLWTNKHITLFFEAPCIFVVDFFMTELKCTIIYESLYKCVYQKLTLASLKGTKFLPNSI